MSPLPPGGYLKALRLYGQELPIPELTVSQDSPLTGVEAVIAFDGATVSGQVKPRRSTDEKRRFPGARVVLIPRGNQNGYLLGRVVETDAVGNFTFTAVVPGGYRLLALPLITELLDPEAPRGLQKYGREVDLEPKESVTVELPLVP